MDLKQWIAGRTIWEHKAPQAVELLPEFQEGVKAGTTKEIASYVKGVYASTAMRGESPNPITTRALGYFLTEHILSNPKYKPTPTNVTDGSRLSDLVTWGMGDASKNNEGVESIKRLYENKPYQHIGSENPSQFEWLLWLTTAATLDAKDKNLTLETKVANLAFLKEEVKRVSSIWSQYKSTSKTGDEVLLPSDRKAKNASISLLNNLFGILNIPSTNRFFPEFNPDALGASVAANVQFDERYQKPVDADTSEHFFDDPEEEETVERTLTSAQASLIGKCHASFFLFEKGYQLVATLRYAKEQPGLRTVEPGKVLQLPTAVSEEFGLPSQLAYVRSTPGVVNPATGKKEKSYIYAKVENDRVLEGEQNEIVVDGVTHQKIRLSTGPLLTMPSSVTSARLARYNKAVRLGDNTIVYKYMTPQNKQIQLDAKQHHEVMELNPTQVSKNVRGSVEHLFNEFFVDKVPPHYRQYMPADRSARIELRDSVKAAVAPALEAAWDGISKKSSALDERTEQAKKTIHELSRKMLPEELQAAAPTLMQTMKAQNEQSLHEMVAQKAREKALVMYMESLRGGPPTENYPTYGLAGKYKTWEKQLKSVSKANFEEHMSNAANWAIQEHGSLEALIPDTHNVNCVKEHFQQEVSGELKEALEKRGIAMPKGLVGLAKEVNPLSIAIFYDRRLTHLNWNYHLDKPLPPLNLSKLAKDRAAGLAAQKKAEQEFAEVEVGI